MLTRNKVVLIQDDVKAALEAVAKKHGLVLGAVKANFTSSDIKITTGFTDKDSTGGAEIDPTYVRNLLRNGPMNGIYAKAGTPFKIGNLDYVLFGMRGTHAIVQRTEDGKLFKYDPKTVVSCLGEANKK